MKHRTLPHSDLTFASVALTSVNTGTVFVLFCFVSRKGKPYVVREWDSSQLLNVLITFSVLHTMFLHRLTKCAGKLIHSSFATLWKMWKWSLTCAFWTENKYSQQRGTDGPTRAEQLCIRHLPQCPARGGSSENMCQMTGFSYLHFYEKANLERK